MKSEVLFVPCDKVLELVWVLSFIQLLYLLVISTMWAWVCVSKVQHCSTTARHCLLTFVFSCKNEAFTVQTLSSYSCSCLVCAGRSSEKEDIPHAVVSHCVGTTASLCAQRSLTLGMSSSWLPWTNSVPPLGGCSGTVCSPVTHTLLALPGPT